MIAYEVEGKVVSTLKELSEILGEKVTKKDLNEGGKFSDVVSLVDTEDEVEDAPQETETSNEETDNEDREIYTALTLSSFFLLGVVPLALNKLLHNFPPCLS